MMEVIFPTIDCKQAGFLSISLRTISKEKFEDDFWNRRFKVYNRWKDKWWEGYQKNGYVSMYTGFRCSGIMRRNECINIPIQGSAFHCLLWSFIQVDKISREQNWKSRLIGQIHDAMVLDVHP